MKTNLNTIDVKDEQAAALADAFPAVRCPIKPIGNRVLVQIRQPVTKTKGGLLMSGDSIENVHRNEQTAKVVKISPSAFIFPTTKESYLDASKFNEGDYVRVPLHGGDNHWIIERIGNEDVRVLFKSFKDYEIIGVIEGNPLEVKTVLAYF